MMSYLHSGVNDSVVHVTAVLMTPLCTSQRIIDSAVTKVGDYKVDFLGEY
jgi:hypothetical protein